MTAAEFKKKWAQFSGKESAAYQSHFDDLCRLLKIPPPLEADPDGEFFCYQRHVTKDAELLPLAESGEDVEPGGRGFADVWKRGCFAWEYKGKRKNLDEAHKQLLRYREALENPPLLVVCDFDRYIVRTNFTGTVQEVFEFSNADLDRPENWRVLRALFTDPDSLKPAKTTAQVTEQLAAQIAEVAKSLQKRESAELTDAKTRAEANFAQRKNLRIARFLNRVVFCFFAEDTGLLPKSLFSDIAKAGLADPKHFAQTLESLFAVMAEGGSFGKDKIRHFNGHLFEDSSVFELTEDELRKLAEASEADWQFIEPSIMGTLFERALEPGQRSQLGAHYTSETDIKTLVEPVLMAPLRREWSALKGGLAAAFKKGKGTPVQRDTLSTFQKKLAAVTVLDPACGSGNFLYVSLQLLLGLEKEVVAFATQLGLAFKPQVSVQQLRAIEINPYAYELAQVSVQIGFLQWRRDNGFDNDRSPILQNLDGFQNKDALLREVFKRQPKDLKAAQAEEHTTDTAVKSYVEREWPAVDVIVGNPPFIGNKRLRHELGDAYAEAVFEVYGRRLPATSDFCCYWLEKARDLIAEGKCQRAGLLATTGSKQVGSRRAFERIKESGQIFFAVSNRDWFDAGTAVRICMAGFSGKDATTKPVLDGKEVAEINADLSAGFDATEKRPLHANQKLCFMGTTKVGDFDLPQQKAVALLNGVNPHGKPGSDVVRPFRNGRDLVRGDSDRWIVDFGVGTKEEAAALYEAPFQHVVELVKPQWLNNNDKWRRKHWWLLGRTLPDFRGATARLPRYIGIARVAKHRLFVWQDSVVLPDSKVIAIAFADDYRFGVLQSRVHEAWTLATCGWHAIGDDATYNPTECFETFPFPFPDDLTSPRPVPVQTPPPPIQTEPDRAYAENLAAKNYFMAKEEPLPYRITSATPVGHRAAIAAAAKALDELRERWLNPPEWTETRFLEFPGSVSGPWSRHVDAATVDSKTGIGTVRYPRLEPKDADCAAKLKKRTLTNLYNERPAWLAHAHATLDAAVAAAYGWPADLSDDEILSRLLALNLERAAEEEKAAEPVKKAQRGKSDGELL